MNEQILKGIETPVYIVDEKLLTKNLEILKRVIDEAECKVLLAQKAFSMYSLYPLIGKFLSGTTASSLHEAYLGREEMGKEVHIYAPAYKEEEFSEIVKVCDHIVFNNFNQFRRFKPALDLSGRKIEVGIRVNPEYSEIETDIYNPCFPNSRFGVKKQVFESEDLEEIDGIHFHTMCEQDHNVLIRTLKVVEDNFGKFLSKIKWVNFGGGHHITRKDYDVDLLIKTIKDFKKKYNVEVYLEPGEAVALNTGSLATRVLDVFKDNMNIAIVDTSAACHMPDVLEMPYRPNITKSGKAGEYEYTYRLGGPTCLAGDVIGDYSFKEPLKEGDILLFEDMAIYSMVKSNTFNGIKLPSIGLYNQQEGLKIIKKFSYEDFKSRL